MSEYGAVCVVNPEIYAGKNISEKIRLGKEFISALKVQDFNHLVQSFATAIRFRALVPPGICEAKDPDGAISWLQRWFGPADQIQLLDSAVELVFDRLYLKYRLRVHDELHGWRRIEQQVYCNVKAGEIDDLWLLCSGFRPD